VSVRRPVAVVGAETSDQFVQAKYVAGDLDGPCFIEGGEGVRDATFVVPAFYEARSDAQVQMLFCASSHLAAVYLADVRLGGLQSCTDWLCAGSECLNGAAQVPQGRAFAPRLSAQNGP
jgi:hypothetical protein